MNKKLLIFMCIIAVFTAAFAGCRIKDPSNISQGDLQKVNFVLDWVPNTNHTGIYVAKVKGFFKEEGLDVSIIQPGESSAEQLVASNRAQFGVSYQESVTFARSRFTLVSLAAVIQHNTSGFGSLKKKGILTLRILKEKIRGWGSEVEAAMVRQLSRMRVAILKGLNTYNGDRGFLPG